jgi:hypothetical protein
VDQCNLDFGDTVKTKKYFFCTFFILKMGKLDRQISNCFIILLHFLGMTAETEKTFFFGFSWKDIIYNGQSARANNK